MAQSPAFPMYAKDCYTGTADLSDAEFGVYMRGLLWSWDNGPLPIDDARRARVLLSKPASFRRIWPNIKHLWIADANGFTNERLEVERKKQTDYRKSQADKGSKGGHAKAGRVADAKPESSIGHVPATCEEVADAKPEPSFAFALASAKEQEPVQAQAVQEDPQRLVQSARPAPSFHDPESRQKLKAAAYAYLSDLTEDGVGTDTGMAKAVSEAARAMKLYDFTGKQINGIVYEVRGYLAKAERDAAVSA